MEYEAKFQLPHLAKIRKRVIANGAGLIQERMLERNLRFDDPGYSLTTEHKLLRLRQDRDVTLTFKLSESFESRIEIELEIDDFERGRAFLEALGYSVLHEYEKYRETFTLDSALIMLDELPFGYYVEIEADSIKSVEQMAEELGFNWEQRIQITYLELFNRLRENLHLDFDNATFRNFERLEPQTRTLIADSLTEYHSQLE